jgi:hypothetical protein
LKGTAAQLKTLHVVVSGTAVQLHNVFQPRAQFGRSMDDHLTSAYASALFILSWCLCYFCYNVPNCVSRLACDNSFAATTCHALGAAVGFLWVGWDSYVVEYACFVCVGASDAMLHKGAVWWVSHLLPGQGVDRTACALSAEHRHLQKVPPGGCKCALLFDRGMQLCAGCCEAFRAALVYDQVAI